jgi:hypothetical protein
MLPTIDRGPHDRRERPIREPILIFGAPRSGTSMLFQALSTHPDLWSLYRESQEVIEKLMAPALERHDSEELTAEDLGPQTAAELARSFFDHVGNAEAAGAVRSRLPLILRARLNRLLTVGASGSKPASIRIVEKNPQNSFRLRFLEGVFPDAYYIFIVRNPAPAIASIYRGWSEPRFRLYPVPPDFTISGFKGTNWAFGRPPGWRDMNGHSLMEICAFQWRSYNERALQDTAHLGDRVMRVTYEDLSEQPGKVLGEIAQWAHLDPRPLERFADRLPVVNTWSRPSAEKWRSLAPQLEEIMPSVADTAKTLGYDGPA